MNGYCKPRPVHPRAVAFLAAQEHTGILDGVGGAAGVVDISEAAAWLMWALDGLAKVLRIAGAP